MTRARIEAATALLALAAIVAAPSTVAAQDADPRTLAQIRDSPFAPAAVGTSASSARPIQPIRPAARPPAAEASPALPAVTPAPRVNDPLERLNRGMFRVHKSLDRAIVGPLARGYKAVAPSPVRKGLRNVLSNLGQPVVFANNVLQGDAVRAGETATRFVTNTTVGVLGVFDVATAAGVPSHGEDFGQTLARYGAPAGPYLFVPLLGPATVRDAAGRAVDSAVHPLTWVGYDGKAAVQTSVAVAQGLDARAEYDADLRAMEAAATDEYATVRSLYFQSRRQDIANGRVDPLADLPDFGTPDAELAPTSSPARRRRP